MLYLKNAESEGEANGNRGHESGFLWNSGLALNPKSRVGL